MPTSDPRVPAEPPSQTPAERVLCEREQQMLTLLARGVAATALGRELGMSPRSTQRMLKGVRDKLGARTTIEAVVIAVREGLI